MKTNEQLQKDVQDAIKWELPLNAAEIGVLAEDGVVTLTGVVDSYLKKIKAEEAAKSVSGVLAVVEQIETQLEIDTPKKPDDEIAGEAVQAIQQNLAIGEDQINLSVENKCINPEGKLQDTDQKKSAGDSVKNSPDVRGVSNNIDVMSEPDDVIEKREIENAFKRNIDLNKMNVEVDVKGNKVILSGSAESIYQKAEAERVALNVAGVKSIVNNIVINFTDAVRNT